jgi:hypothetical protein
MLSLNSRFYKKREGRERSECTKAKDRTNVDGDETYVGNDKNTSLEVLQRLDQSGKRLSIEVVGGLVKHDDV